VTKRKNEKPSPGQRIMLDPDAREYLGIMVTVERDRAGLTMQELADKAGLSYMTVNRVENGTANVRILTLSAIAAALGTTMAELVPRYTTDHDGRFYVQPD
jgi:transcriptional regulator with XRE-family HTH domain